MTTVGEALVANLESHGVEVVFGIPGVHTLELYRGLAASNIRHVTPRHEQGAGFMADGYARVSGKPGVAFVITGPGLTNTLTPIAQARADSVPILVVSAVNATPNLGSGRGHLHELPDQQALASTLALTSEQISAPADLAPVLANAFATMGTGRAGPTHVQIPLDVARLSAAATIGFLSQSAPSADPGLLADAANVLSCAKRPVILAGGGAKTAGPDLRTLAERLDAPVVQTVNARGLLHSHPLGVPASPSLKAVRDLVDSSDVVLAVGTELGPTDYDMNATGRMVQMPVLVRIDICEQQLARHDSTIAIPGDAAATLAALNELLDATVLENAGAPRARRARDAALEEIGPKYRADLAILEAIRDAIPTSIMVGDSTQPVYAGNLFYDHDRAGGWFNAATGYGALGYGIPAAIGAAIASPGSPVVSLLGDGGAQFTLPEIMTAVDENLAITFIIWNNHGYLEIAQSMQAAGVTVIGCDPLPPDFKAMAAALNVPYRAVDHDAKSLVEGVKELAATMGPVMIEIECAKYGE